MGGAYRLGQPMIERHALAFVAAVALAGQVGSPAVAKTVRQIAPELVAPPQVDGDLQRETPRAPLGDIGRAALPKPKKPKGLDGNKLFNPLGVAAGVIEVKGLTVTVAGIDVVPADETCSTGGKDWACGVRARTAFRGFLRGRAVGCDLPPDTFEGPVTATCWIGKQDVGDWLVSNGWARPQAGGPYEEAGEKAKQKARGIFGPPPNLNGLTPEPAPYSAASTGQAILAPDEPAATTGLPDSALPPPAQPTPPPAAVAPAPAATPPVAPQGLY